MYIYIWVFPKIMVPQNGWFIMVPNPIKMDDLGVPLFLETPLYIYIYLYVYIPLQGTELGDLLGAKLAKMNRSDW